jgi:hypothetical protein
MSKVVDTGIDQTLATNGECGFVGREEDNRTGNLNMASYGAVYTKIGTVSGWKFGCAPSRIRF